MQPLIHITRFSLIILFFLCWQLGASTGVLDPYFFGMPSKIAKDLWSMTADGSIFFHTWITLLETLTGFTLGGLTGILLAFLLAASSFWARVLDPIIMVLYGIPRIALAPLFILWFGLGMASKVVFAFALVLFLVFFNTFAGLRGVNREMIDAVKIMGATRYQILVKVLFPYVSPWIIASLKSGVGMALLGAIVGEYIGGNAGLGWLISYAAGLFETNRVFSALIALGLLVAVMNEILNRIERRLLKWRPKNDLLA
jgi:NitT/TauT family transport system permease protein